MVAFTTILIATAAILYAVASPLLGGSSGRNALPSWFLNEEAGTNRVSVIDTLENSFNSIIPGHWNANRMHGSSDMSLDDDTVHGGATDPEPVAVPARAVSRPYRDSAPVAGKVFFDTPDGPRACSGTAVRDPARPGTSNLVWTAGHCVHKGAGGSWFRNIVFVPSYNDQGLAKAAAQRAPLSKIAPFGTWWADGVETSPQWISKGKDNGGPGAAFDFAVLHVRPPADASSLQESLGDAATVRFDVPAVTSISSVTVLGYPAAAPFSGEELFACQGRPSRLSVGTKDEPTMYRTGCTMTSGSSGGGWFSSSADGSFTLVSNTSIGGSNNTWIAGPYLGRQAQDTYTSVSERFSVSDQ
ncbi:hypothetical protein E4K73_50735 [Streptomyces sp. IB201691-2A2]|nr:hypothetical protein E4K73_50735 [Streptomyces sp. IB201691-2A2]